MMQLHQREGLAFSILSVFHIILHLFLRSINHPRYCMTTQGQGSFILFPERQTSLDLISLDIKLITLIVVCLNKYRTLKLHRFLS